MSSNSESIVLPRYSIETTRLFQTKIFTVHPLLLTMAFKRPGDLPHWYNWSIAFFEEDQNITKITEGFSRFTHDQAFIGVFIFALECLAFHNPMPEPYNRARNRSLNVFFQIKNAVKAYCDNWPNELGPRYVSCVQGNVMKQSSFLSGCFLAVQSVREQIRDGNLDSVFVKIVDDLEASICHRFFRETLYAQTVGITPEVVI